MRSASTVLLLLAAAAAGCGTETDERPATFSYIHQAILVPTCASAACHNSLNEREDFVLDDPTRAYDDLSTVTFFPDISEPDPETTGLMLRLRGNLPGEVRMPLDSPLPEADILLIGRWIADGAGNN